MKLEKRNENLWKVYLRILELRDIIQSKTKWHGPTWSAATQEEIEDAKSELESSSKEFRQKIQWIPEAEVRSWDEYQRLAGWGLIQAK